MKGDITVTKKLESLEYFNMLDDDLKNKYRELYKKDRARFHKLFTCGSYSVLLKDKEKKDYLLVPSRCKDNLCYTCYNQSIALLNDNVRKYAIKFNMLFFTTITTNLQTEEQLKTLYESIIETTKSLNRAYYESRNSSTNKTYEEFIHEIIEEQIKIELDKYLSIFAPIDFIEHIGETVKIGTDEFRSKKKRIRFYKSLIIRDLKNEEKKAYSERVKEEFPSSLKEHIKGLKSLFYSNSKEKFEEYFGTYSQKYASIKEKIDINLDKEFACIRKKERQNNEQEYPHYHLLSNYPILDSIIKKHITTHTRIYDFEDIRDREDGNLEKSVKYLTKYISKMSLIEKIDKELLENEDNLKFEKVITATQNIKLFEDRETSNFKKVKVKNRVMVEPFKRFISKKEALDYMESLSKATQVVVHPNPLFQQRERLLREYNKHKNCLYDIKLSEIREKKIIAAMEYLKTKLDLIDTYILKEELEKRRQNFIRPVFRRNNSVDISSLDETQRTFYTAIEDKFTNLILLTGDAGTGKTSVLQYLDSLYPDAKILYGSYTGKAVSRIKEKITKIENAKTISLHLRQKFSKEGLFGLNEGNLLLCDIFVVDEVSMLDKWFFINLLNSLKPDTLVILIGDDKQLPPIRSGSIISLLDNIDNDYYGISRIKLDKVYRSGDSVITHLNAFKQGNITFTLEEYFDSYIKDLKQQGYQFLSNTKVGVEYTNKLLKRQDGISIGPYNYAIGQSVMFLKNDYKKDIYNGQVLQIKDINVEQEKIYFEDFSISFTDAMTMFSSSDCLTVHKSQGSEYNMVCVILDYNPYLVSFNLLYTAISRAKVEFKVLLREGWEDEQISKTKVKTKQDKIQEFLLRQKNDFIVKNDFNFKYENIFEFNKDDIAKNSRGLLICV